MTESVTTLAATDGSRRATSANRTRKRRERACETGSHRGVRRVRDMGSDIACYFGVGEGSERARAAAAPEPATRVVVIRTALGVVLFSLLHSALGLDDGLRGWALTIGLVAVVAGTWALARRAAGWRRRA